MRRKIFLILAFLLLLVDLFSYVPTTLNHFDYDFPRSAVVVRQFFYSNQPFHTLYLLRTYGTPYAWGWLVMPLIDFLITVFAIIVARIVLKNEKTIIKLVLTVLSCVNFVWSFFVFNYFVAWP